jgi:hypothetical protein
MISKTLPVRRSQSARFWFAVPSAATEKRAHRRETKSRMPRDPQEGANQMLLGSTEVWWPLTVEVRVRLL